MPKQTSARPRQGLSEPIAVHHPHWTAMPLVLAALALPLVPWAMAVAVAVPWMASVDGLVVNGEAVLRSHPIDLFPGWALWGTAAGVVLSLSLGWGAAVRIVADTLHGHTPRMRTALLGSARRLHLTLVTAAVTGGVLYGVDTFVLAVAPEAPGPVRYSICATVFAVPTVLWRPPVSVHADECGLSILLDLRGHALLTGRARAGWVILAVLAAAPLAFALPRIGNTVSAMIVAAVCLIAATIVIVALTFAAVAPGQPEGAPIIARTTTAVACAAVVLVTVLAPGALAQRLLDGNPWSALSVERTASASAPVGNGLGLTPDGEHLLVSDPPQVCDLDAGRCESPAHISDRYEDGGFATWAGATDKLARAVQVPGTQDGHPPGTVALVDACLPGQSCERGGERVVEPDVWSAGEWGAEVDEPDAQSTETDWQEGIRVWATRSGGHDLVVTALPVEPFSDKTLLSLVTCVSSGCGTPVSTPLAVLGEEELRHLDGQDALAPDLVDMAMSEDGRVTVTVHDPWNGALTLYTCDDRECGETERKVLAEPAGGTVSSLLPNRILGAGATWEPGIGASVEFRPDGSPVIVYADAAEGSVHLVDCQDEACEDSSTVDLAGPSWERPSPALTLDSEGLAQVVFHDPVSQTRTLLSCTGSSCAEHDRVRIGVPQRSPLFTLLHMGPGDRPQVVAGDEDEGVESVRCVDPHCGGRPQPLSA